MILEHQDGEMDDTEALLAQQQLDRRLHAALIVLWSIYLSLFVM